MLVFGAVVAGLVPVLMAILSIIVALGLVALISLEFTLSVFIVNMLTGMGLALGIDYSLFVVSRYREERGRGLAKEDAIARSGATASRAVLFSGSTFVIALLGMFIVPTSIMRSLALGAILVGIVSVAAALTLLPALLSMVGDRVNALPRPDTSAGTSDAPTRRKGRFWRRIVDGVLRRPALWLTVVRRRGCSLSPRRSSGCTSARTASARCPTTLPSKQGYVLLQRSFPEQNPEPVRIVAVGGERGTRAPRSRAAQAPLGGERASFGAGDDPDLGAHRRGAAHVARSRRPGRRRGRRARCATLRADTHPGALRRQRGEGLRRRRSRPRTSTTSTPSRTRRRTSCSSCSG